MCPMEIIKGGRRVMLFGRMTPGIIQGNGKHRLITFVLVVFQDLEDFRLFFISLPNSVVRLYA